MQVPTAGPQPTDLEQAQLGCIKLERALHQERIMGSRTALELLDMRETALADAINARMREDTQKLAGGLDPTRNPPADVPRETSGEVIRD